MRLYFFWVVIGVFSSTSLAVDREISLDDPLESGSFTIFSDSSNCSGSYVWNIVPVANLTSNFVKSLVISNLALEDGGSFVLKSDAPNGNVFTVVGEGTATLPILYLGTNATHILNYTRGKICSNYSRTLLQASWSKVTNDACAPVEVTGKQFFKSYNYPNNYPLKEDDGNTQCRSVSSQTAFIYVTFHDLDLAEDHRLEFADKKAPVVLTSSNIPGDAIVSNKTVINFLRSFNPQKNTVRNITYKLSGRGFNMELEALDCGGKIDDKPTFQLALNATEKSQKCMWIIRTPVDKDPTILKVFNFTLSNGLDNVIIYDSDTIKNDKRLINISGADYYNSTSETIIVQYTSSNTSAYLNWSTIICPDKCLNGRRCINPSQRCNNVNDCGDWSDELHCNGTIPVPPPKIEPASGVPGLVVVFVIIPISLIIGILGTIFLPRLVARIRDRRYQEFREYSDVS
ncbi:uncharacterized protein LOC128397701 [Panonychus citri]|uniref:uncharacterized protein LOC128397701 n=1 Tax=Panonychus citri TaxID=50023 RepID=UPI002307C3EE|nr:uncharacterized protein LOC128397701 [Panonychus citri]